MKRTALSLVMLACLVMASLIIAAFTTVSSANAQLGNTGVPVSCGGQVSADATSYLTCTAADGTPFGTDVTVPSGHYLLVTDVQITPMGPATGDWEVFLDRYSTDMTAQILYATQTRASFAEHYTTPYLVARPGERLRVRNIVSSSGGVLVYVSGLLTTNVSYMPLITR